MAQSAVLMESTVGMDREAWLEHRKRGIGGSDAPVIFLGSNHPFQTPRELWEIKLGLTDGPDETPIMTRGKVLEPIAANIYAEQTGRKIRRVNFLLQHPEYPWMLGNIDRKISRSARPGKGPGILEIKCPGIKVFSQCKWEGVPDYWQIQMQHYLAVSGLRWGSFQIFNAEAWDSIHFDIDRDDELIELILERNREFWSHVENRTPPREEPMAELEPLPANPDVVIMDSDGWLRAVDDLREASGILKEAKALEENAKERLKNLMSVSNACVAQSPGFRAYRKPQAGKKSFDYKALLAAHPEIDPSPYYRSGKPFMSFRPYFLKEENDNDE